MCLITEQKKPIKIREDLTSYKVVKKESDDMFSPWSYDYYYDYRLDVLHKEEILADSNFNSYADETVFEAYQYIRDSNYTHVHDGFHSALNEDRIKAFNNTSDVVTVKCLIPKGSLVFKDKTGLIVSNQIILKEIINK